MMLAMLTLDYRAGMFLFVQSRQMVVLVLLLGGCWFILVEKQEVVCHGVIFWITNKRMVLFIKLLNSWLMVLSGANLDITHQFTGCVFYINIFNLKKSTKFWLNSLSNIPGAVQGCAELLFLRLIFKFWENFAYF